jgi:hypothetical protein
LLALVEPVLDTFEEIVTNWRNTRCPVCNQPSGDLAPVVRVGQLILDRAGHHPTLTIQHETPTDDVDHMTVYEALAETERLAGLARQMIDQETAWRQRVLAPALDEEGSIIEAVLSEPEPEARTDLGGAPPLGATEPHQEPNATE